MGKKSNIGVNDVAKNVKKIYIGVGGVAKKIKKAYIGDENGIARQWFGGIVDPAVQYTGNFTNSIVTMSGKNYRLITLISSGTLTLSDEVDAEIWFCDGGKNGAKSASGKSGNGGNGGFIRRKTALKIKDATVVIGAGNGGKTSITANGESIAAETFRPPQGGAGVTASTGATVHGTNGAGAEYTTRPFDDTYFSEFPCGAGGGGNTLTEREIRGGLKKYNGVGGGGGSDVNTGAGGHINYGGYGGATGGGNGGHTSAITAIGSSATYYGSGGGGGWAFYNYNASSYTYYSGGSGYQGVCFIRIPLEE